MKVSKARLCIPLTPSEPVSSLSARMHTQVVGELRENFGDLVFRTIIQRNIRLSEAPSYGKPIILYDVMSTGSSNYLALARELLQRNETQNEQ